MSFVFSRLILKSCLIFVYEPRL